MLERVVDSPLYAPILGLLCGTVGFRIGWRLRHPIAIPLAQTVLGVVAFAAAWRSDGVTAAAVAVASWGVGSTIVSLPSFMARPARVDRSILGAAPYRAEMLAWLRSGRGFPVARTVRRHVWELAGFVAAATLTGNALGLAFGAVLLNKMNAWVAATLRDARRPAVAALLAWNVWSVLRAAAYIALGAACAVPVVRAVGLGAAPAEVRRLVTFGLVGVAADIVLKLALSPAAGRALARAVDLDRLDRAAIVVDRTHPETPHGSS